MWSGIYMKQERMWCHHLDESQEEKILWADMDQAACSRRTLNCTIVKEEIFFLTKIYCPGLVTRGKDSLGGNRPGC